MRCTGRAYRRAVRSRPSGRDPGRRRGARIVVSLAVVLLVVGILIGAMWLGQRKLIYLPSRGPVAPAATVLPGAEDVSLTTVDGLRLGAWFVPARGERRDVTVLVANGNAGDRSLRAPLAAA